jgi:hypothetical protein
MIDKIRSVKRSVIGDNSIYIGNIKVTLYTIPNAGINLEIISSFIQISYLSISYAVRNKKGIDQEPVANFSLAWLHCCPLLNIWGALSCISLRP